MRYKIFVLFIIILSVLPMAAQNNFSLVFDPEINLEYNVTSKYTQDFGIENRNYIYNDSEYEYQLEHIGFTHQSTYNLNDNQSLSLGLKYRFRENFEQSNENEFRLQEAFEWNSKKAQIGIKHEIRTEQRFYKSTTKHRLRYELGLTFPLKSTSSKLDKEKMTTTYLKAETETLYEIAKTQKPEFEQRLSGVFGWYLSSKMGLEIGLQYRLADYTQNSGHELFLVTGIDIKL